MNTTADEADRFFESCRLHLNDVLSAYICVNLRLGFDFLFFALIRSPSDEACALGCALAPCLAKSDLFAVNRFFLCAF
jgi:hypothetical protein